MKGAISIKPGRRISSETAAFRYIIDLIYERTGIQLHQGKETLIQARLGKRIRHLGLAGLTEYCNFLQSAADKDELEIVVNALTTNFTHFLREEDHFKFLVKQALPSLPLKDGKKFQIWCAASSSGEEPYTIGLYLSEFFPPDSGWDWHINASDISTKVLEQARSGIYPVERLEAMPRAWLHKYFQQGCGRWDGCCRVRSSITNRVSFQRINLMESFRHPHPFEIIFCRNVLIYFDRPTQQQLVERLCHFLAPNGYLFVGHAESLNGLKLPLRCLRPSIYQRSAR
jgi:chemotaxis protein methyltransferase CheR